MTLLWEAPVISRKELSRDSFILTLRAPEIARNSRPGQFVMVAEAGSTETPAPLLRRALAVYSVVDHEGVPSDINLLVKLVGEGTRRFGQMRVGQLTSLVGPLGNGFDLETARNKLNLLVAGGTGIASVYLLARALKERGDEVHLLYGGRTKGDLVGLQDFESLDIPIRLTTDDGSHGLKGLVILRLPEYLGHSASQDLNLYTCGPNPMMQAVCRIAREHQIPCQISVESKMACGFGVCLGCSVKTTSGYRLACTDGPVFAASEFIWEPGTGSETPRTGSNNA